ncbi:MAG: hypothetical protein LUQ33_06835 [Methanoregulaceae archaeon]|nr:hypothetical protein [Methanoregulaceae archaeon]
MKLSLPVLLVCFISSCFVLPCSAVYFIQDVSLTPLSDSYLPGSSLNTSGAIRIIPSGPTTFIEGYTLVLSTDLDHTVWNVRVFVDGRQAAVFQKFGTAVFINGYLLSYPVTSDVEVYVTLEGMVPLSATEKTFSVFGVRELNNQGKVVPESEQIVTRAIAPPATLSPITPQSDSVEATTSVANVELSLIPVTGSVFLIFLIRRRMRSG